MIDSPDTFKQALGVALNRTRMKIINLTEVVKKAESELIISKPIITGPGRVPV